MVDVVDPATRSKMMAGIRGRDTKPEIRVRRLLHAHGFRFRLHRRDLPGRPDIVLPKHRLAIFIHGCFWHRHEHCHYATTPSTRPTFWREKFAGNVARDRKNIEKLREQDWRVFVLWECGLRHQPDELLDMPSWILSEAEYLRWPQNPPKLRDQ